MKNDTFNALLVAARPEEYKVRRDFTDKVMVAISSSEIFSHHIRKMNVNKKETFIMRLRYLPKFMIIAIVLGCLVALSGSAYAAYHLLWSKPEVNVSQPTTSANGRQEVSLSLAKCGGTNIGSRYELKNNATITADDIPMVVKAQCELNVIDTWARATFPNDDNKPTSDKYGGEQRDRRMLSESMATHIKSNDAKSITFAGLTKYGQPERTFTLTPETRFIADGHDVKADAITTEDPILYITTDIIHYTANGECTDKQCSMQGGVGNTKLMAVVKLSQPFEHYDQFAWQSLTEVMTCEGNPEDNCVHGGAIDLYQAFDNTDPNARMKEAQGFITAINAASFTIKSSSGSLFTITPPSDVISSFNKNRSSQYNNQTVRVGSGISVRYMEEPTQHSKSITGKSITSIQLQIEIVSKGDPIKAY